LAEEFRERDLAPWQRMRQQIDGMGIVNRDVQLAPCSQDAPQLQEPRRRKVLDVGEHGPGVHDIEIPILERQVRHDRVHQEAKRWRQVLRTPYDVLRADIRAPDFAVVGKFGKPTDHSACRTPEIEDPRASLETRAGRPKEIEHGLDVSPPIGEVFLGHAAVTGPQFRWWHWEIEGRWT
jgi:hypothetical protein